MPQVLKSVADVRSFRKRLGQDALGFVPTMGALHEGHASLMAASKKQNAHTAMSIFVNPTQFNNADDLKNYPVTLEQDLALADKMGVEAVWLPTYDVLYPDKYTYKVIENDKSMILCGAHRPGHFDGVLSVVMKLFMAMQPTRAYFGEKDYQQLALIKGMVEAFFLPIEIVPVPIMREKSGLAMSSRNRRLTPEQLDLAPSLFKILSSASSADDARGQLETVGMKVDYVEEHWNRRLAAVTLGGVRLIDNVPLTSEK